MQSWQVCTDVLGSFQEFQEKYKESCREAQSEHTDVSRSQRCSGFQHFCLSALLAILIALLLPPQLARSTKSRDNRVPTQR